jgi:hypothetical protein
MNRLSDLVGKGRGSPTHSADLVVSAVYL